MATQKTFSTFEQQVDWLCHEKRLLISDRQYADDTLKHIGYFPLMGGYKHLFRIPLIEPLIPKTMYILTTTVPLMAISLYRY